MGKHPWHAQPGRHCLWCSEETLEYRYEERGKIHILHCTNCQSVAYSRKEYDVKMQTEEGED